PLVDDRRPHRAHRQSRRAELERGHLQIVEADHRAAGADRKGAARPDASVDRQAECLDSAVRESVVEAPGPGPNRTGASVSRCPAALYGARLATPLTGTPGLG